jgi:hypothetical protein
MKNIFLAIIITSFFTLCTAKNTGSGGASDVGAGNDADNKNAAQFENSPAVDPVNSPVVDSAADSEKADTVVLSKPEAASDSDTVEKPVAYRIGDRGPAGGYIFYENPNYASAGWRYLEAAAEDLPKGAEWGVDSVSVSTSAAIGTGKKNTANIIAALNPEPDAAQRCKNYTSGGKSDWFLPSKDELNLMYKNLYLHTPSIGGFSSHANYWSSSQSDSDYAWFQYFNDGTQDYHGKYTANSVRPVRSF